MPLHINIQDLIVGRTVESDRIEYKKGWNPGSIYRSICAFANDIEDIGGGYIIVGIEEKNGKPVLPPIGVEDEQIDRIQREMVGYNNLINPVYFPKVEIEEVDGKKIVVIWALSGTNRPYEVPEEIKAKDKRYQYYIRVMSSTVKANKQQRENLIALANKVPFDDRPNTSVSVDDISFTLIKEHLRQTKSRLLEWVDDRSKTDILSQMELLSGPPERSHPRNVALMMFTDNPEKYFPYSRVEVVHFPNGADDPTFTEAPAITGPVPQIIRQTLLYLKTAVLQEKIRKIPGQPEAVRIWNYPYTALEEIVANCLYHRDYQTREPVEIRVYPNFIVFLNYGGPGRNFDPNKVQTGPLFSRRYRNRRLGDFLKELDLTEGKATGIPIIKRSLINNGSPDAEFETDEDRSYFQVVLKIHPDFLNDKVEGAIEGVIEGAIEGAIEGVTKRVKEKLTAVLSVIAANEGKRTPEYAQITGINAKSLERYITTLRNAELIFFSQKATQIGGYYLTDELRSKLSNANN
jgi:Predicted transcriptional regulator containing an HTH domain and an uncharacterized domain shared with the mammalian protein Schlafen